MNQMCSLKSIAVVLLGVASVALAECKFTPTVVVKETYDDNVFLQDRGALANKSSMITTITPVFALTCDTKGTWNTTTALSYTPELAFFHSEHSEDYVSHALAGGIKGKTDQWAFDFSNNITFIDGSDTDPTYLAPGAIPAMGAICVRDRRDADIYRSGLVVTYTPGDWMIRPRLSGYVHDFQTKQFATAGYENYVDRAETIAGIDVGHKIATDTYAYIGYRFGWQHQSKLLDSPLQYSNRYHRLLIGAEGKPAKWAKFAIAIGPDFRDFYDTTLPDYDTTQVRLFVDASATLSPTPNDDISFVVKRYLQPSFCGKAIYEDMTWQTSYKHRFGPHWSSELMLRDYAGDWGTASNRDDVIYTISLSAAYKVDDHLSFEAGYSYDQAESNVTNTAGREFHRNVMFLSGKYAF